MVGGGRAGRRMLLIIGIAAITLGPLALWPIPTSRRDVSPDGEFTAVVSAALIHSLVPVMPGHGSDKPGRISVIRRDGRSCGSAAIDMVWMISDLRWELEMKPRRAVIPTVATWNLDACRVEE